MRIISQTLAPALALIVTASLADAQQKTPRKPVPLKKGYVAANGVNYYYEIHGKGEPLLLLHGGLGSIGMFEPDLAALAKNAQVIAVDLYGHGRTALTDRPISLIDMGDDMALVLKGLGVKEANAMGYSLGGGLKDAGWQRENMSKNRLAILPNVTHYEMAVSPALVSTALPFLNGETGAPSGANQVKKGS